MRKPVRAFALVAAAVATVLAVGPPPASADPTATVAMPQCCVTDTVALGASVFALAVPTRSGVGLEQATLVRVDTASNTVTGSLALLSGVPTGNMFSAEGLAVVAGAIWVTAYWENEVLRVDPVSMTVAAAIPVGRSPDSLVSDGRSVWVALNNGQSVSRIDPAANRVAQTVRVGSRDVSDSPFQLAFDGSQVLASLPVSGRIARIDPGTGKVRYDAVGTAAAACARILPVAGGYWLDDTECSPFYFRWDARRSRISVALDPTTDVLHDWGAVVVGNAFYTDEFTCDAVACSHGLIVKRDPVTGAEMTEQSFGTDMVLPHYAAGSLWIGDFEDSALQRVAAF
jgi:streptogramin lyase